MGVPAGLPLRATALPYLEEQPRPELLYGARYSPHDNPAEGAWANMKNGLGNLAARDVDQLAAIVRNRLRRIQYRPALIDGFLAQAGLDPRTPAP